MWSRERERGWIECVCIDAHIVLCECYAVHHHVHCFSPCITDIHITSCTPINPRPTIDKHTLFACEADAAAHTPDDMHYVLLGYTGPLLDTQQGPCIAYPHSVVV